MTTELLVLTIAFTATVAGLIGFVFGGYNEFYRAGGSHELERENFTLRKIISDASTGVNGAGATVGLSPTEARQRHLSAISGTR